MTRVTPSAFPELRRVFSAYLHEDFGLDYDSPEAALRAFRQDADADEVDRFEREAKRFLAETETLDLDALRSAVGRLGSRWLPPSRDALTALLVPPAAHERSGRD